MKTKFLLLLCVAFLCASCAQTYHFVQVFETQSSKQSTHIKRQNGGLVYEDDECLIFYSLWADGGDASFGIFNKTDQIMYIDLSKSFFIRNGIANDYYKEREWGESATSITSTQITSTAAVSGTLSYSYGASATYLGNLGNTPNSQYEPILSSINSQKTGTYGYLRSAAVANSYATSSSSSVSSKEQKIISLPPHSSKIISEYSITNSTFLNDELDIYPSESSSISFNENNSPLNFSNFITYRLGNDNKERIVENEFYISKITNYATPYMFDYIERQKENNNKNSLQSIFYPKIYDKYYIFDDISNRFFINYEVRSKKKMYNFPPFYFVDEYNGYIKKSNRLW